MQRGSASLERINEILQEKPSHRGAAQRRAAARTACAARSSSAASTVATARRARSTAIDLRIPAGSHRGHRRATPARGKSTLVNLIPRLLDPTAGAVLLDGVDLRELDPAELRRHIGFVPQETFLFSATIAENIAFGVEDATEEQIRRAAELAGLAADIDALPRRATRPWSASAASRSPAARSSAPPSPAPSCATRAS